MPAVRVQLFFVYQAVFVDAYWPLEDVNSADQDKGPARYLFQVTQKIFDVSPVAFRVAVGKPFLSRRGSAKKEIELQTLNLLDIRRPENC